MTNIETFRICLGILAKGMAGVLIVAAVIILCMMALNRFTRDKTETLDEK